MILSWSPNPVRNHCSGPPSSETSKPSGICENLIGSPGSRARAKNISRISIFVHGVSSNKLLFCSWEAPGFSSVGFLMYASYANFAPKLKRTLTSRTFSWIAAHLPFLQADGRLINNFEVIELLLPNSMRAMAGIQDASLQEPRRPGSLLSYLQRLSLPSSWTLEPLVSGRLFLAAESWMSGSTVSLYPAFAFSLVFYVGLG